MILRAEQCTAHAICDPQLVLAVLGYPFRRYARPIVSLPSMETS